MQYVYGDGYGDVAGRELQMDSARDNRFFQSLAANRAAQAQAMQAAQMQQEAQYRAANLGLQQQQLDQSFQSNQLARQDQRNQFDQNLAWHKGNLDLERDKFKFQQTQPTPSQITADDRMWQQAQEANNRFSFSKNLADLMNQYQDLNTQKQKLQQRVVGSQAVADDYNNNFNPVSPFGAPKQEYVDRMAAYSGDAVGEPEFGADQIFGEDMKGRADAVRRGIGRQMEPIQAKIDTLAALIQQSMKTGGADVISQDPKTGKFVSTVPQPPAFDFSKMRSPLAVRPGASNPAPTAVPPAALPATPAQYPMPVALPPPRPQTAMPPQSATWVPPTPAALPSQTTPGNGGSSSVEGPIPQNIPLDQRSGFNILNLSPVQTAMDAPPAAPQHMGAEPTMDFSAKKMDVGQAKGMVKVLVASGMNYQTALNTVKALMGRQRAN
jgi:hypothetical protein